MTEAELRKILEQPMLRFDHPAPPPKYADPLAGPFHPDSVPRIGARLIHESEGDWRAQVEELGIRIPPVGDGG